MSSLKQKTISGIKWSAINQFSVQSVNFLITLVIARILSPQDYGVIGMLTVFISISSAFVDSGFSSALVRKQNRTEEDLSTVFYFNIGIAIVFYFILYICAPFIANFYNMPLLIKVARYSGLILIFQSFSTIQIAYFTINLDFKTPAKIGIISSITSGGIGVILACLDCGVWALVFQTLTMSLVTSLLYWYWSRWSPVLIFSIKSFKELFSFGSKLLMSGLLDTTYNNFYPLIIGKFYSAKELGFFTRAKSFAMFPSTSITSIVQKVSFPVLSEIQNESDRLSINYRKFLKMTSFIIFPIMIVLVVLGKPLIILILTEKWLPLVPYMQILCISSMLYPLHAINLNLLQIKGRSDLFLKLEVIKKIIGSIVLIITIPLGVFGLCIGIIFTSYLCLLINTHYTGKLINLGFWKQANDITPFLLLSFLSGIISYFSIFWVNNLILKVLIGGSMGFTIYLLCAYLLKFEEIADLKKIAIKN